MEKKKYKSKYSSKYKKRSSKNTYHKNKSIIGSKTKTHRLWTKYYIDNDGKYQEKPWHSNFWKVGFLNDIPTKGDYHREMDGVKYMDSIIDKRMYGSDAAHKEAMKRERHEHLYGLERAQISFMRLWNGSPREWIKLIVRVLIVVLFFSLFFAVGHYIVDIFSQL